MILFIKYRIIFCLLALISGILAKTSLNPPIFLTVISFFLLTIFIYKKPAFLFLIFFPLGILLTVDYRPDKNLDNLVGEKVSIKGVLTRIPEVRENSTRLFVKAKEIKHGKKEYNVDQTIIFYLRKPAEHFHYGDEVIAKNTRFEKIKNFKNPGSFNLNSYYKRKNIHYSSFVNGENLSTNGKFGSINPVLYRLNLFRSEYINFVRSSVSYPESEIINALSVGEKSYFPSWLKDRFSALGLSHIFAISGLHIGFVAIVFFFMIKWSLKRSEYLLLKYQVPKIAAFFTIFPVALYVSLTGFSIPAIRAFLMIVVFLTAIIIDRSEYKINTLGFAGLIILIYRPNSLFDLSFQLSFLSIFGILLLNKFYPLKINSFRDKIVSAAKTTIAATFITLPLTINSFGYLPALSIPANLLMLTIVEFLIVPISLLSVLTFIISADLTYYILILNSIFIYFMLWITQIIEDLGIVYLTVPKLDKISVFLIYLLGLLILIQKKHGRIKYLTAFILVLIVVFNTLDFNRFFNKSLKAHFLDSGNKNIAVVELPDSKKVLINGGYSYRSDSDYIERSVLIPFLRKQKISSLDLAVYTSLDKSHLRGLKTLTNRINLNELWINGTKLNNSVWENIYEKNIYIHKIQNPTNYYNTEKTQLVIYRRGHGNGANIYDSRHPQPVLIFIYFNNNTIVLGESLEDFSLEDITSIKNRVNRNIDVFFLPDFRNTERYRTIINAIKPSILICRECFNRSDYFSGGLDVYDIDRVGMVKVEINSKSIGIKKYFEQ